MDHGGIRSGNGSGWRSLLVFLAFTGIILFFLLSEHRLHALSWLPLILLAACPLMHMFHHGGHGGHGQEAAGEARHGAHGAARQILPRDPAPGQTEEVI